MSTLTFLFRHSPHNNASGREGVDALLAASAYSEDIQVLFVGDGVYQLLHGQDTSEILSKDYAPMLKLFDLYDIEQVFACSHSLKERGLLQADLVIDVPIISLQEIQDKLQSTSKVLTF
ncbi:sulfurtransferase complex subunit TusC [Vibrio sonorensis]|uniref:sulfurtransferase complex subunit TusC n=1 Tax=Vibrio sonorensis TaxID=1004316 RepID=UPI0008DB19F7|nr:sulfurtransferase complex subunit TusC [Vibrio sonorensis]